MKYVDKEPFKNMGFEIKGKRNDIILGTTLGLFMMALGYAILQSLDEIQFSSEGVLIKISLRNILSLIKIYMEMLRIGQNGRLIK